MGPIVSIPEAGGLHHRYECRPPEGPLIPRRVACLSDFRLLMNVASARELQSSGFAQLQTRLPRDLRADDLHPTDQI
jgi:hypothetical protein